MAKLPLAIPVPALLPVWIVGRIANNVDRLWWEFCGVFGSEEDAVEHCSSIMHFVGPAIVGRALPEESHIWEGAYYPRRKVDISI